MVSFQFFLTTTKKRPAEKARIEPVTSRTEFVAHTTRPPGRSANSFLSYLDVKIYLKESRRQALDGRTGGRTYGTFEQDNLVNEQCVLNVICQPYYTNPKISTLQSITIAFLPAAKSI